MYIDIENADFYESVFFLLDFVKKHNKNLKVDLPDFPFCFDNDYQLTCTLMKLAHDANKRIESSDVDFAIEALECEWELI